MDEYGTQEPEGWEQAWDMGELLDALERKERTREQGGTPGQGQFPVQLFDEMPDTRVTMRQAEEARARLFSEGVPQTLLPDAVPGEVREQWQAQLAEHMAQEDRGGDPEALVEHHLVVNLPPGANIVQQHHLVRLYAQEMFTENGLLVHYVIHRPHYFDPDDPLTAAHLREHQIVTEGMVEETGERILLTAPGERYTHAHIAVPVYPLQPDGHFADTPHERWDDPALFLQWRREWAEEWDAFKQQQERGEQGLAPDLAPADRQLLAEQEEARAQEALMRDVVEAMLPDTPALPDNPLAYGEEELALVSADDIARIDTYEAEVAAEAAQEAQMALEE